ncbi:MAG: 23S rRNA (adenine(2503)-C(2))-methyltransferase RlmN [Ignavibacteria bacterium]|nr:23S rRNA (adenine(2503)-C(2))-methyltransferase RlmN [Ignavibacteria bacterium]
MLLDIYNYTLGELEKFLQEDNIENYRATQIYQALHKRIIFNFNDIKNIPESLRHYLSNKFKIPRLKLIDLQISRTTKTKKYLFELPDSDLPVETVFMQEKGRTTLCISVQSGCNLGCVFCSTGYFGFKKNLSVSEILLQIYEIIGLEKIYPTNIVYMGMGEPFLNYDNFLKSLKILCSGNGLNINSSKITVSTIGLKSKIKKFADDITSEENKDIKKVKLALSLHSTDNGIRDMLIPISKKNKLSEIYNELIYYYRKTGTKITYEYIFLKNINNKSDDVKRLIKLSKMVPSNVNIIRYHPTEQKNFLELCNNYSEDDINEFIEKLRKGKVVVNLRKSNGIDIKAACGQLAAENYNKIKNNNFYV